MTPSRRRWLMGAAATAGVVAGGGAAWWRSTGEDAAPLVGDLLWSLRLPRPGGGELALASLRGRPLLINFWATWCTPCVRELPDLTQFQNDRAAAGWQVLAIAVDRETAVQAFVQQQGLTLPVVLAGAGGSALMRQLGNAQGVLPFSVVVDSAGRLRQQHAGQTSPALLKRWGDETKG